MTSRTRDAVPQIVPQQIVDAFNDGRMSSDDAAQFRLDVERGVLILPEGAKLADPLPGPFGLVTIMLESVNQILGNDPNATRH